MLPVFVKLLLYNSLVLSDINYCILAWGYASGRLERILKKCIRVVSNSKYNAHTEPLYKKLELLKLKDILVLIELKFYYKYKHQHLPNYFITHYQINPNHMIHTYDTRQKGEVRTVRTNHSFADKCLRTNLPKTINSTSYIVLDKINTHSLQGFANYFRACALAKYSDVCLVQNCYTCTL